MIKKWKTLDSRYIIRRPWLTARVDRVQLPSGVIHPEHYVLEYPDWVNVIAITGDGMFVMIRQYRHAMDQVLTELCAGVSEQGETPALRGEVSRPDDAFHCPSQYLRISVRAHLYESL